MIKSHIANNPMVAARHVGAIAVLFLLAILQTWPLAAQFGTHLPGTHTGDNVTFAWNLWWMREAVASPAVEFFRTDRLFAPPGTALVLHTHTALLGMAGASLAAPLSVVSALGVLIIGCVFLNGATAYGLAWHVSRSFPASLLAGVTFGLSPVLALKLMGHFNLLCAWTLVLAVWFGLRALESGRTGPALIAGLVAGFTAWADYYLFVYATTVFAVIVAWRNVTARITVERRTKRLAGRVFFGLSVVTFVGAVAIIVSGGLVVTGLPIRISMRSPANLMTASWILLALGIFSTRRVRARFALSVPGQARRDLWVAGCAAIACVIAIAPLARYAVGLWLAGDYVEPPRVWRSAPRGIDLATLVLGPPLHGLVGPAVLARYGRLGIDVIEASAWLGMTAPILTVLALRTPGAVARPSMAGDCPRVLRVGARAVPDDRRRRHRHPSSAAVPPFHPGAGECAHARARPDRGIACHGSPRRVLGSVAAPPHRLPAGGSCRCRAIGDAVPARCHGSAARLCRAGDPWRGDRAGAALWLPGRLRCARCL